MEPERDRQHASPNNVILFYWSGGPVTRARSWVTHREWRRRDGETILEFEARLRAQAPRAPHNTANVIYLYGYSPQEGTC
jgi:hypothetical protein